jgi:hypothetical protein
VEILNPFSRREGSKNAGLTIIANTFQVTAGKLPNATVQTKAYRLFAQKNVVDNHHIFLGFILLLHFFQILYNIFTYISSHSRLHCSLPKGQSEACYLMEVKSHGAM